MTDQIVLAVILIAIAGAIFYSVSRDKPTIINPPAPTDPLSDEEKAEIKGDIRSRK